MQKGSISVLVCGSVWCSFCRSFGVKSVEEKLKLFHSLVVAEWMLWYLLPEGRMVKWVCGVLHDADGPPNTLSIVDVIDWWEWSSYYLTSCLHFSLRSEAPCQKVMQLTETLSSISVECGEDGWWGAFLAFLEPQEVETLIGHHLCNMERGYFLLQV